MSKTQLQTNNEKLTALITELEGKAAGGGGSVETCTVELGHSTRYDNRPYCYSYTYLDDSGNVTSAAVSQNDSSASVTLNNVICGSVVTVFWHYKTNNLAIEQATQLADYSVYFNAYRIEANAGGTAYIYFLPDSDGAPD